MKLDNILKDVLKLKNEKTIRLLKDNAVLRFLKKGEMLIRQDEVQSYVTLLIQGGVKCYSILENGKVFMNYLEARSGVPIVSGGEENNTPAMMSVETIADSEILQIPKKIMSQLMDQQLEHMINKWLTCFLNECRELRQCWCLPTTERYLWLVRTKPEILPVASQKDIAQLLNMTPQRLSVIRHQLRQEGYEFS